MTTKLPASFLPAKFQVLSGSALKLIAITLMLIDHTGLMILYNYPATTATLFSFGGVDYSWGADALALMHDYVVTMMLYVLYLTYAIAALVTIYASLQIFIKMNAGEEGIVKEILMVVGACMFMIGASIVFPAFFGYQV